MPAARRLRARQEGPVLLARYDGRRCVGHVRGYDGEYTAYTWPGEILIGTYATVRQACAAIDAADANSRAAPGRRP